MHVSPRHWQIMSPLRVGLRKKGIHSHGMDSCYLHREKNSFLAAI